MVLAVSDGGGRVMAIAGNVGDGVFGNDGVGSVGVGLSRYVSCHAVWLVLSTSRGEKVLLVLYRRCC